MIVIFFHTTSIYIFVNLVLITQKKQIWGCQCMRRNSSLSSLAQYHWILTCIRENPKCNILARLVCLPALILSFLSMGGICSRVFWPKGFTWQVKGGIPLLGVFWLKFPCTKNCDMPARISVILFICWYWFCLVLAIVAIVLACLAVVCSITCPIIPVQSNPGPGAWSWCDQ